MANLAPILYSAEYPGNGGIAETVSARHAPSLNAAFAQLYAASGIKPGVKRDVGGARTKAQCNALGTSWTVSDHYEESPKGRAAVDIDNQRAIRNKIGSARFEAILAANGWRNIQTNGRPFPTEPWHFANHDAIPQASPGSGQLIQEEDMFIVYIATAAGGYTLLGTGGAFPGIPLATVTELAAKGLVKQAPTSVVSQARLDELHALFPVTSPAAPLTEAQIQEIADELNSTDDAVLLAAIASSKTEVLAAIKAANDDDLAQWGLQRIP